MAARDARQTISHLTELSKAVLARDRVAVAYIVARVAEMHSEMLLGAESLSVCPHPTTSKRRQYQMLRELLVDWSCGMVDGRLLAQVPDLIH